MGNKDKNPFIVTWQIISTFAGAIGLVNVTEDVYKWADFIAELAMHYRTIVYWPFELFPFRIPNWIKNYIFFGFLYFSSFVKALNFNPLGIYLYNTVTYHIKFLLFLFLSFLLWPIILLASINGLFEETTTPADKKYIIRTIKWTGAILLILFCLLIASIIINR